MHPSPAELARTLASGWLPGIAHLRGHPGCLPVRHATGVDGRPLLLTRRTTLLAAALQPEPGRADTAMVLSVDDVPPVRSAPCHGRLWLSGWASPLAGAAAQAAAVSYAQVSPCSDLLDVGRGQVLFRLEVAEVRLASGSTMIEVDLDDYLAATTDPLHPLEADLLADLAAQGGRRLRELARTVAGTALPSGSRALRVDRFGLVLATPDHSGTPRQRRLDFPEPVTDLRQLAELGQ